MLCRQVSQPGAAKPTRATRGVVQVIHLDEVDLVGNALEDELRDARAYVDLVVHIAVVEQEDTDFTSVVQINHSGTHIESVLNSQS